MGHLDISLPAPRTNITEAWLAGSAGITSADVVMAAGDFTGGASEDLFTAAGHGLSDGDQVKLLAESAAGVVTGALDDTFYVKELSSSTFQLTSDAANEAIIENSADGTAVFLRLGDLA